jgi:HAD superfamily hydrolase (TIGR01549 family)
LIKKFVIFDVDGTLLDTRYQVIQSLQNILKRYLNIEKSHDELSIAIGLPGNKTLEKLGIENVGTIFPLWQQEIFRLSSASKIYDGIEVLLSFLKKEGSILGIVTSRNEKEIKNDVNLGNIINYFDIVVEYSEKFNPKPSPDQILYAIERTSIPKVDAVYIGDTLNDYYSAKNAGIDFIFAKWGWGNTEESIPEEIKNAVQFENSSLLLHYLKEEGIKNGIS